MFVGGVCEWEDGQVPQSLTQLLFALIEASVRLADSSHHLAVDHHVGTYRSRAARLLHPREIRVGRVEARLYPVRSRRQTGRKFTRRKREFDGSRHEQSKRGEGIYFSVFFFTGHTRRTFAPYGSSLERLFGFNGRFRNGKGESKSRKISVPFVFLLGTIDQAGLPPFPFSVDDHAQSPFGPSAH